MGLRVDSPRSNTCTPPPQKKTTTTTTTNGGGIKAWVLADAANGYTCNFKLYMRKESNTDLQKGLAHRVVMERVHKLKHSGYNILCDIFYTSTAFFTDLRINSFGAYGTARLNW